MGWSAFQSYLSKTGLAKLNALNSHDKKLAELRIERSWADLFEPFSRIYASHENYVNATKALCCSMVEAISARPEPLRHLDLERDLNPDWFLSSKMVGYVFYIDRFAGKIDQIASKLDYLSRLGVTYIHLMPCLKPREGDNDGGYSVENYNEINPDFGSMKDLNTLAQACHARGMSICIDLVLNHTAQEHEWAMRAKAGDKSAQDMYYIFEDDRIPTEYEKTLVEIFPDQAPGSFTFDPEMQKWVWTTFNTHQWDLNWRNPDVFVEIATIIFNLANQGVDILRLDAVAFMWKEMGTSCQNLPEVHELLQALRAATRMVAPAVIHKAEAIVAPKDLAPYLGTGKHTGKVANLAYHNNLMVQFWNSIASQDTRMMRHILHEHFPAKFENASFVTYLRCHDDIGWAITPEDAGAIGADAALHREFLADFYKGDFPNSYAKGSFFQYNPRTNDKRSNGTLASLLGLETATDQKQKQAALDRILLGHALIASFGGIPLIYMGDEYGALNDPNWQLARGGNDDSRWLHRPVFDQKAADQAGNLEQIEGQIFQGIAKVMKERASLPAFSAAFGTEILFPSNPAIFAFKRQCPSGNILCIFNFINEWSALPLEFILDQDIELFDHLSQSEIEAKGREIILPPYARLWLGSKPHAQNKTKGIK